MLPKKKTDIELLLQIRGLVNDMIESKTKEMETVRYGEELHYGYRAKFIPADGKVKAVVHWRDRHGDCNVLKKTGWCKHEDRARKSVLRIIDQHVSHSRAYSLDLPTKI